jgi:hypothetical protein
MKEVSTRIAGTTSCIQPSMSMMKWASSTAVTRLIPTSASSAAVFKVMGEVWLATGGSARTVITSKVSRLVRFWRAT